MNYLKIREKLINFSDLYKYSLFNSYQIGIIISLLMSILEKENYEYLLKEIKVKYTYFDSWGSNFEMVPEEVALIYKQSFNINLIKSENDLSLLKGLVLCQKNYIDDIRFYNSQGQNILQNNTKYNYVNDFIDYIILKKITYGQENLTLEEMKKYLSEFIVNEENNLKKVLN